MKDERTLADRLEAHAQRYERSALMAENRAARRTEGYKAANERGMARLYLSRAADLHEAAQALRSQPSVEGWGPIESAPKDGTHFMAVDESGDSSRCAYHSEGYILSFCGQPVVQPFEPILWMPWPSTEQAARQITALYKGEGDDRP